MNYMITTNSWLRQTESRIRSGSRNRIGNEAGMCPGIKDFTDCAPIADSRGEVPSAPGRRDVPRRLKKPEESPESILWCAENDKAFSESMVLHRQR